MPQFRLSKYDPALRDATGAYTREEWTSYGDIGRTVGGARLDAASYRRVEDAYVQTIEAFLDEAGITSLTLSDLELPTDDDGSLDPETQRQIEALGLSQPLHAGDTVQGDTLAAVCRLALRGLLWCKLQHGPETYVHFGYDLYAYVGTPGPATRALALAGDSGLFAEPMRSPYLD